MHSTPNAFTVEVMTSRRTDTALDDANRLEAHAAERAACRERVRWRSRRGLLELELLLLPFVRMQLASLDDEMLAGFAQLLERDDWDIFEWLQERAMPPADLAGIVVHVRQFLAQSPS